MSARPATLHALLPFAAIDFETADRGRDSACSVAVVRVEAGRIVRSAHRLIRPPRARFEFTHVHGLRLSDVEREPLFRDVWADVRPLLDGVEFLAAHNAPFDQGVLAACCRAAGLPMPPTPFRCTVRLARAAWRIFPTRLPDVCDYLGIPLKHHDALSDAEACAAIVCAAACGESARGWVASAAGSESARGRVASAAGSESARERGVGAQARRA
jgi:DNA polymerase-3 subunit epsilon